MRRTETIVKNGKPYVLLPQPAYEKMLQQLDDAADDAALERALARGEEGFPLTLFDAIRAGASPVRVFRQYRDLTQQQLADRAGILRPMLSAIENGKKSGSIATVKAIAAALDVPLEILV